MPRKKNGSGKIRSQVQDRWAGGWEVRAGGPGRDGWPGPVWAGGCVGTCVFLHKHVRRNRLGSLFRAVCLGKKHLHFTRFFLGGTGFFRGKSPAKLGESPARRAQRWKMRSEWSASTCRASPRELQRKCCCSRAAAYMRRRECCSVRLAARCCDRKMRRRARRQHQSGGTNAAA